MSVRARIASSLAANAFGQAVNVGSQLLLTPLFFRFWGAAKYGEWLILSSIPAYLSMADLGIGAAAGNEMAMRAGAGDQRGAQQTFLGALWVACGAAGLALLAGVLAAAAAFHWQVPATPHIPALESALILVGLASSVALGFVSGVLSAGFRCAERNALGILLANVSRLLEAIGSGVLLLAGQSPLWVCLGATAVKFVMLLVQAAMLRRVCPWLFAPGAAADRSILRRLIAPALGFLALPMGNALALQGPVLIIGAVMGGPAVATFSALRTMARVPMQITNMINASVWPEMSRAFGAGNAALLRRLHQIAWGSTMLLIVAFGIGLVVTGERLTHAWLGPHAPFNLSVLAAMVLITILAAAWGSSGVVLAAINAHVRMGAVFIVTNGSCLGLAALLAPSHGWLGLLGPLVLADSLLLAWVLGQVIKITGDTYPQFFAHALVEPWMRLKQKMRA